MIIHWSLRGAGVVPLLAFENTKSSSYLGKLLILQIKNKKKNQFSRVCPGANHSSLNGTLNLYCEQKGLRVDGKALEGFMQADRRETKFLRACLYPSHCPDQ